MAYVQDMRRGWADTRMPMVIIVLCLVAVMVSAAAGIKECDGREQARGAKPQWEEVAVNLKRFEVPGGWLYRTWGHGGCAMVFVPYEKGSYD